MTAAMDRRAEVCRALGAHVLRLREEMAQVIQRLHAVEQGRTPPTCGACGAMVHMAFAHCDPYCDHDSACPCHACGTCDCHAGGGM